jgi:hypothetical protein
MQKITETGLAAYQDKIDRRKYPHRLVNSFMWGKVTDVQGGAGTYQVQIVRTGEQTADGGWYPVQTNGIVPAIGDQVELQWRDEKTAWVTSLVQATPRVADMHNIKAKSAWSGSFTLSSGWTSVTFNGSLYDPSGMGTASFTVAIPGFYLCIVHNGVASTTGCAAAIYVNGVEATLGTFASDASGDTHSTAVDVLHFSKGDVMTGWIFANAGAALASGADRNYMAIHLLSAD